MSLAIISFFQQYLSSGLISATLFIALIKLLGFSSECRQPKPNESISGHGTFRDVNTGKPTDKDSYYVSVVFSDSWQQK